MDAGKDEVEDNESPLLARRGDSSSAATKETFGQFLVSKLIRDVALFVHLANRALCLDSVASRLTQDADRPNPGLH